MGKFIDLTGERYGKLVVLERVPNREQLNGRFLVSWLCICDCGNETIVGSDSLRQGNTKSCGCYRGESSRERRLIDLTGSRFGRLLVIKQADYHLQENGKKVVCWICLCDCGNETIVYSDHLSSGHTISCGCYQRERVIESRFVNLVNSRFGKLTVLSLDRGKVLGDGTDTFWLCQCDCGNRVSVDARALGSGNTSSCGCSKESLIAYEVKGYFSKNYVCEKEYRMFKNPKTNCWLWCDIYIPCGNNCEINGIYIEINGEQHYIFSKFFHKTKEDFEDCKYRDKIKKKYAQKYGTYIEVDLRKIKTTEEAIIYIENKINLRG